MLLHVTFGCTQSSQNIFRDRRFESRPVVGSAVFQCMNTIPQHDYKAAFSKLIGMLKKCVDANGKYFEDLS
jgi:hypothetical protein